MVTAVYPGSFDPATYGHLDVIRRASVSFDRVVVGVLQNSAKSPLFSVEERVNILEKATKDIPNVVIRPFDGLSVNFARENHAQVIVRGLRAVTDLSMSFRWHRPIVFWLRMLILYSLPLHWSTLMSAPPS